MREIIQNAVYSVKHFCGRMLTKKEQGIDGILVTVGLCIIALALCVVMRESLTTFITTIVTSMTGRAQQILNGTTVV